MTVRDDIRAAARAVGERTAGDLHELALAEDDAARAALAALAEADLLGWAVPAAYGGRDAGGLCPANEVSVRAMVSLRAELAWHSGMLDVMAVMQGLGSYAVARAGSAELASAWLPRVARGEAIAAFALTEPGAGSDLAQISTRARRDRDAWVLDGSKTFISNAGIADLYTVLARTDGQPGEPPGRALTMFLVPGDAMGLEVERFEVMAPHPIGDVHLRGVRVPDAQRLGEEGRGLGVALATLGRFRTTVAAAAAGFGRRALFESCERLRSRRQFGEPLAANQGLRFDVAEMDARLRASELLVEEAAAGVDGGDPSSAAVARAKLFATETASWVCDRAVQHFGGSGVKRGILVERLFRDVRALRIYEGTSEIQKLLLARELLD